MSHVRSPLRRVAAVIVAVVALGRVRLPRVLERRADDIRVGRPAATAVSSDGPSATTRMICADEAGEDIANTLGVKPLSVSAPEWTRHVYSCRYTYRNGSFALSVRQLDDPAGTTRAFDALRAGLGRRMELDGLGQGAFTTTNGSVVVRKDNKVLLVDVARLPVQFGVPADTRANAGISIAATIMGCWTGE